MSKKVSFLFLILLIICSSNFVFAEGSFSDIQENLNKEQMEIELGNEIYVPDSRKQIDVEKDNIIIKGKSADSKAVMDGKNLVNTTVFKVTGGQCPF